MPVFYGMTNAVTARSVKRSRIRSNAKLLSHFERNAFAVSTNCILMPGLLAGLFAGGSTPQGVTVESQHAQPASVSSPASLPEIHEQLRALNDPDVALKGDDRRIAFRTCMVVRAR